jgi:hypothetical protein
MSGDDFLHELEHEVEADLTMLQAGHPEESGELPPSEWTADPAELAYEETALRSLLGAVETMEGDTPS